MVKDPCLKMCELRQESKGKEGKLVGKGQRKNISCLPMLSDSILTKRFDHKDVFTGLPAGVVVSMQLLLTTP